MRDEQMSYRGSLALGCVGLLMGITVACSGGSPTSPSGITGGSSQLLGSSGGSSSGGSSSGVSSASIGSGAEVLVPTEVSESPEDRGRSAPRRRRYCESVEPGHEHYQRCQAFLKSDKDARLQRVFRHCQNLPTDHKHYTRCQRWLKLTKSVRVQRVRRYCESLPPDHKHYERCQSWRGRSAGR